MGIQVHLRTVSDPYDEQGRTPYLDRDFRADVTTGDIWKGRPPFLTPEETKLLEAPYYEDFDDEPAPVPVDPSELARVLTKVKDYLWMHRHELQHEIVLDYERMEREGLPTDIIINQSRCWIHGYTFYGSSWWWPYAKTESKVLITSYNMEPNSVELWVDIQEQLEIEGRTYYLTKIDRYEEFAPPLEQAIAFCTYAESIGEQVYWLHTHC